MQGLRACLLTLMLLGAMSARGLEVVEVSPLTATPQDTVRMSVHFNQGEALDVVHTYRYGNSIQVYVIMDDTSSPNEPPAPARTESFDLGRYPVGEYRIDIYNGNLPLSAPIATRQLGVVARTGIPVASPGGIAALGILTLVVGMIALRSRRTARA